MTRPFRLRAPEPSEDELHEACARLLMVMWPQHPPEKVNQHGVRWISHELRIRIDSKDRVKKDRVKSAAIDGAGRKKRGCRAGDPDMEFNAKGIPGPHFIELKTRLGKLFQDQIDERKRIIAAGGQWALCRSVDELLNQLDMWGFPTRATARMQPMLGDE